MRSRRRPIRFTDSQCAEIAWAECSETTTALARRLNLPFDAVARARRRFRDDGYCCPIHWAVCPICNQSIAGRTARHRVHIGCRNGRDAGYARRRYARLVQQLGSGFLILSPEQRVASLDRLHQATIRDQEITLRSAYRGGKRWTQAEDALLRAYPEKAARDLALQLGRSRFSVARRRCDLRRDEALEETALSPAD